MYVYLDYTRQMSFSSEIPHFCGTENPTDFMLSKQVREFIGSNLNRLIGHVIIQPFCCCKQLVLSVLQWCINRQAAFS